MAPITSSLARSITTLAFAKTRALVSSTRAVYVWIAPWRLGGRGARGAGIAAARASGGFDGRGDMGSESTGLRTSAVGMSTGMRSGGALGGDSRMRASITAPAAPLEAQDVLESGTIRSVGLVGPARPRGRAGHEGEALRPHLEADVRVAAALDGRPISLAGLDLEQVPLAPAVHDDLDLVVRLQQRLQTQHELAALQRIARHDAEAPARWAHVAMVPGESRRACRP